jgi:hypothetical protein
MKKLLFMLPLLFITVALHAQQTEDEVYIGKKYGNYKGTGIIIPDTDRKAKPLNGPATITGIVIQVDWCEKDCRTILVKKEDGTTVTVGTSDHDFTVSKKLVGKKIIIEGTDPALQVREKKLGRSNYQKNIQFAASGILIVKK